MPKSSLAVLISGRGSNLAALIEACKDDSFPAEISLVISNKEKAAGLQHAEKEGIATKIIDQKGFARDDAGREAYDAAINEALAESEPDYICLAGFMRLLTPGFVSKWRGKLVNIHPSLLPSFKGLNVHGRMLEAGLKIAGCTVHFVSSEVDSGPIIGQAAVPVLPDDTEETLAARILAQEHKLYPACIRLLAEGKARLTAGNRVALSSGIADGDSALQNPS